MKKKLLSTLLSLCTILMLLPEMVQAWYGSTSGTLGENVTWSYNEKDHTLTVKGTGSMYDYSDYSLLWSGNRYFIDTIIIDEGVTTIGDRVFLQLYSLTSVTIPNSVVSIGYGAFSGCNKLSNVNIPNSVVSIGERAFSACSSLSNVAIPDHVTTIGANAFAGCSSLSSVNIPNSTTTIGSVAFGNCSSMTAIQVANGNSAYIAIDGVLFNKDQSFLHTYPAGKNGTSYSIPASVTTIGNRAFHACDGLTNVIIPKGVTTIEHDAFESCHNLTSVTIPDSVTTIDSGAFSYCTSLTDVYYGGSESQWKKITISNYAPVGLESGNGLLLRANIHYDNPESDGGSNSTSEHIYDAADPGASVTLDAERLNSVTDSASAISAVQAQTRSMTTEQKASPTGADLATLYAETAVSRAASKTVSGTDILINKAAITELESIAKQTSTAVESALVSGGVSTARYISNVVTLTTEETGEISIRIDPDILTTEVDKVVVEAPTYAITLKVSDFKEELTQILTITTQDVGSGFAPGSSNEKPTVKVNLPNGKTSNSVTLSLPKASGDTTYQTVVNTSGTATSSKYNPATTAIDGKVNTSGSYTVQTNQADFTDISNKSAEMQTAIRYLAARGIIGGTGGTNYSPDDSITRAQIAALVIRALGKVDEGAKPTFKDVTTNNWYYSTAAVSQKAGIINGYEDNTYRGDNQILKEQIVAIAARVLKSEMGYKEPSNTSSYLSKYSDSVAGWAQPEVALATRENIVVYRTDGTFSGAKGMTRGDAAIIIYRLFQRIW